MAKHVDRYGYEWPSWRHYMASMDNRMPARVLYDFPPKPERMLHDFDIDRRCSRCGETLLRATVEFSECAPEEGR